MTSVPHPPVQPGPLSRPAGASAGMVVVGTLLIVAGFASACLGGFSLLMLTPFMRAQMAAQGQSVDTMQTVTGFAVQLLIGVALVWSGIGTLQRRRWVRPIMLCLGWTWLVTGIMGVLALVVVMPLMNQVMQEQLQQQRGQVPPGMAGITTLSTVIGVAVSVVLYVIVPALLVWYFMRRAVRDQLHAADPVRRWTDACPIPVLGLALAHGLMVPIFLVTIVYGAMPVLDRIVTGPPVIALAVVLAAINAVIARGCYRMRGWAWWGSVVFTLGTIVSMVIFLAAGNLFELYRAIGMSDQQLDLLSSAGGTFTMLTMANVAIGSLLSAVYLLWVRRHFVRPTAGAPSP